MFSQSMFINCLCINLDNGFTGFYLILINSANLLFAPWHLLLFVLLSSWPSALCVSLPCGCESCCCCCCCCVRCKKMAFCTAGGKDCNCDSAPVCCWRFCMKARLGSTTLKIKQFQLQLKDNSLGN